MLQQIKPRKFRITRNTFLERRANFKRKTVEIHSSSDFMRLYESLSQPMKSVAHIAILGLIEAEEFLR